MCKIHCISYPKDGSCLAFAGKTGYRVWAYEDCRCMARCARHPPDYTTCRSAERCYIILGEYLTTLFLLPGCYGGWHWRLGPHGPVYSSTPPHMTHRRPHVTHSDSIIGTLPVTWEGRRARWLAATAVVLTVAQLLYWHSHGLDYQEFSLSLSLSLEDSYTYHSPAVLRTMPHNSVYVLSKYHANTPFLFFWSDLY